MEWPDLADLTPYDRNAKQHPDGQVHVVLARGQLKVAPGLPAGEAFRHELRAFERTISDRGYDSYAGRGEHENTKPIN